MPDTTAQTNQNIASNPVPQQNVSATPNPSFDSANQPSKPSFLKTPLLTLVSLVFLVSVIAITAALYLENNKAANNIVSDVENKQPVQENEPVLASQQFVLDESVQCANFENLDDALRYPDKTCGLILSGQNLTSVPEEIYTSFPNLVEVNLSNNNLTEFPTRIIDEVENLVSLDLSNNDISSIPDSIPDNQTLVEDVSGGSEDVKLEHIKFPQILILDGNPLPAETISSYERSNN